MPEFQIRWMIRRDLRTVVEIEAECFGADAYGKNDIIQFLKCRNVIGYVVEMDDELLGYMIFALEKEAIHVLRIASRYKREGIGRLMLTNLKQKVLRHTNREQIVIIVPENNLEAQLWLRSEQFQCATILPGSFENFEGDPIDGYAFEWSKARNLAAV